MNPVAVTISKWRKDKVILPRKFSDLATQWLAMSDESKQCLLAAAAKHPILHLPESLLHLTIDTAFFMEVYRATAGQVAPVDLMPPELEYEPDEELESEVEEVLSRLKNPDVPEPEVAGPDEAEQALWEKVLEQVKGRKPGLYRNWLHSAKLTVENDTAVIHCLNEVVAAHVRDKHLLLIRNLLDYLAEGSGVAPFSKVVTR